MLEVLADDALGPAADGRAPVSAVPKGRRWRLAPKVVAPLKLCERIVHGAIVVIVLPREHLDLLGQQPADGAPALGSRDPGFLDGDIVELDGDVPFHPMDCTTHITWST